MSQQVILEEGAEWPTVWAKNPGTGFREPIDKPLVEIVMNAVYEMRRNGDDPTRLLVGVERRSKFVDMVMSTHSIPCADGPPTLCGIRVEWVSGSGMSLAGDANSGMLNDAVSALCGI